MTTKLYVGLEIGDLDAFLTEGLGWEPARYDTSPPADLSLYVAEGPQTIAPSAVYWMPGYQANAAARSPSGRARRDSSPATRAAADARLLVWNLPQKADGSVLNFDEPEETTGDWNYPPSKKFERLLHEANVPIGVLANGAAVRLIYAPRGEAAGHIDFRVADAAEVGGRPIFEALVLLLGDDRLTAVAEDRQLHSLLARSRAMQAEVTTELAKQVFEAAEILLRAFEAADARTGGAWLRPVMERQTETDDPLYEAILTVLLRFVFLLYAEDAGLLPTNHPLYARHYSLYNLYDKLEADHARAPDAMDRRYAAWPGLLALFRALFLGVSHGDLHLPPREGHLFDPHRFPFLEGVEDELGVPIRDAEARQATEPPTIDDESIYLILRSLLYLRRGKTSGGERISYRNLYVEQIGSVYEGLMGYRTERIVAPAVRLKPSDSKHTPTWVTAAELLEAKAAQRKKWLKEHAGLSNKASAAALKELAAAEKELSGEALIDRGTAILAELRSSSAKKAGDDLASLGRIVIQPGSERKRTSSHYTPQSLSGPIVARALEPLLACFGDTPSSDQILSLKICDPAMGSGAFLVEACRFLGEKLLEAWIREDKTTSLASQLGETGDLTTYARRQVAERCLYGVDKNPFAVELAKLSLWLTTLQKEKPFTFLDHALRCGDSLVGCTLEQITAFDWRSGLPGQKKQPTQLDLFDRELNLSLGEAIAARDRIAKLAQYDTADANREMRDAARDADDALSRLRLIGNLLVGVFFSEPKDKARNTERLRLKDLVENWLGDDESIGIPSELSSQATDMVASLRPFHWTLEFPEVFWRGRVDPLTGKVEEAPAFFDAVIGNPPFGGKNSIAEMYADAPILDWFKTVHPGAHGNADSCAHFFRRADTLLADHGTTALIATNTIAQGDTRTTGLRHLVASGSTIYEAQDSIPWPGPAAVTVSVVHLAKGAPTDHVGVRHHSGKPSSSINSRLRPMPERPDPVALASNATMSFVGTYVLGMGFTLTPKEREGLVAKDAKNAERIFAYLGGKEVNTSPTQSHDRYVISFGQMDLEQADAWPDLIDIVRAKVKPERDKNNRANYREKWWQHGEARPGLYAAIAPLDRCLVTSCVSKHLMWSFQPTDRIYSHKLFVFPLDHYAAFATLQSRLHDRWTWLLSSTMKTDLNYSATDCFETFPFPKPSPKAEIPELEAAGETLYTTRANFMVAANLGLTQTYNLLKGQGTGRQKIIAEARSRIPDFDAQIENLRQLHTGLDRAVLAAYAKETGDPTWNDIPIPPYQDPQTDEEKAAHQHFEDLILDKLFALNTTRANK